MLRVGIVDFVNSLPIFHALKENIIPHNAIFSFGTPAEINKKLLQNELDTALISAAHFLEHRFEYILLSDLGIAATKEVISIRLFSKKNRSQLHQSPIFLPPHSASSVKFLKTLCLNFWNVAPLFSMYPSESENLFSQDIPFLVIGDECLRFFEKYPEYPSLDLASEWYKSTEKSSVYAVIATKNSSFRNTPKETIYFQTRIEESFSWAQQNRTEIIKEARKKTGCSQELLEKYFSLIEYQLTPKHFHGLDYLATLG